MDTSNTGPKTEMPFQAWPEMREPRFFIAGGTLAADAASYLSRAADDLLLRTLLDGQYAYVLDSRQKGKSSLVSRTQVKLESSGVKTVKIDLQSIGSNLNADQWYASLVRQFGRQLGLEREAFECWGENYQIGPFGRWLSVIEQVVLPNTSVPIVVFLDEVDFVRSLPFSADELFAGIRECFNRRAGDEPFTRLTFCIIGSATPSQLVQNVAITPFNVGQEVKLTDFDRSELSPYALVLNGKRNGEALLDRVYYWTRGHPYLTQAICAQIAEDGKITDGSHVDRLVERTYLSTEARQREPNLLDVSRRLLETHVENLPPDESRGQMLNAYGQILRGEKLLVDDSEWRLAALRLSGAVSDEGGSLTVRNEIYRRAFGRDWIRANMPDAELRRQRKAARVATLRTGLVASVVVLAVSAAALGLLRLSNDRKLALTALEKSTAELKRQNYIGKMASIRLAIATNRWMRAADLVAQTKDDPYRGWEWGHAALLVNQDITEYQLPRDTILEPSDHDTMLAIAPEAEYEVGAGGVKMAKRSEVGQAMPYIRRGNWRVRLRSDGYEIRDVVTGKTVASHSGGGYPYDVDPAHRTYLMDTDGPRLEVRSVEGDKVLVSFKVPDTCDAARFLPDGTFLTIHSGGLFVHWDSSGSKISSAIAGQFKNADPFLDCALSPDGSTYIVWGQRYQQLEVRRTSDHGIVSVLAGPPTLAASIAFSPDGRELLIGGIDGVVNLFEIKTGRLLQAYPGHKSPLKSVDFFSSGTRFASIDVQGNARVWARARRKSVEIFRDQTGQLRGGGVSKDGKFSTSVTSDGTIFSRDTASGKVTRRSFPGRNPMMQIRPINDDRTVVGFADGHVEVLNGQTLKPEVSGQILTGDIKWLWPYYGGRRLLVEGVDNKYAIVDRKTLKVQARFELKQPSGFKGFGKAGRYIAFQMKREVVMNSGTDGKPMRRWLLGDSDPKSATGVDSKLIEASPNDEFTRMAYSPDGRYLAVSVGDSLAPDRILLLDTEESVEPIELGRTRVSHLQYSPKGDLLAVLSWDGALSFWDIEKKAEIARIPTGSKVYALTFSPDCERFITNGTGLDTTIWDTKTFKDVMTLDYQHGDPKAGVGGARGDYANFSVDGRDAIMSCTDGTVRTFHSLPWKDEPKTPVSRR